MFSQAMPSGDMSRRTTVPVTFKLYVLYSEQKYLQIVHHGSLTYALLL